MNERIGTMIILQPCGESWEWTKKAKWVKVAFHIRKNLSEKVPNSTCPAWGAEQLQNPTSEPPAALYWLHLSKAVTSWTYRRFFSSYLCCELSLSKIISTWLILIIINSFTERHDHPLTLWRCPILKFSIFRSLN